MKFARVSLGFWLANLALLLLYGWTLTEESAFTIEVTPDRCTAVFPERSSDIPCSGLTGGFVGVYLDKQDGGEWTEFGPLDWLAPRSAWRNIRMSPLDEPSQGVALKPARPLQGWQRVGNEWQPVWDSATMRWQAPFSPPFALEAVLRRPAEVSGILLLAPDGENGWAFVTTPEGRRGVWWRWRDGSLETPIVGIPFQRSTLSRIQSLLNRILRAHHGALLLIGFGWVAGTIGKRWSHFARQQQLLWQFRRLRRFIPPERWMVIGATLGVFCASILVADEVLERIPHVQDSITYLFQATTLAKGKLWAPALLCPNSSNRSLC